jgi:hypothetical protein
LSKCKAGFEPAVHLFQAFLELTIRQRSSIEDEGDDEDEDD